MSAVASYGVGGSPLMFPGSMESHGEVMCDIKVGCWQNTCWESKCQDKKRKLKNYWVIYSWVSIDIHMIRCIYIIMYIYIHKLMVLLSFSLPLPHSWSGTLLEWWQCKPQCPGLHSWSRLTRDDLWQTSLESWSFCLLGTWRFGFDHLTKDLAAARFSRWHYFVLCLYTHLYLWMLVSDSWLQHFQWLGVFWGGHRVTRDEVV